jgi:hypothetical protein
MPSPFPGMDPYLESPSLWPDVHHEFISEIRAALNPKLRPKYVARVELRVYVSDEQDPGREVRVPDLRIERVQKRNGRGKSSRVGSALMTEPRIISFPVEEEIQEAFLEIRVAQTNDVVTIVEVLSPSNKVAGSAGRESFLDKRRQTMASEIHWVEIDLLRTGLRSVPSPPLEPCDYYILTSRGDARGRAPFWPVSLREKLPIIGVPLKGKDPDVLLDLGAVLNSAYDRAAYDATLDYRKPPTPPLSADDAKWANALLREKGLRR